MTVQMADAASDEVWDADAVRSAIRQWAAWLCEHKPNSKRAVAVLRQARLDRVPEGDWIELLGELERVAETYKLRRSITDDDVAKALLTLGRAYQEEQDKTEDSK